MRLIINADDFGLTSSVNQAIIASFQVGNITSTTLMMNMPGTEDAVEQAQKNPSLAVGLHFCLTEGKPLSNCSTLINSHGYFYSRVELTKRILQKKISPQDVIGEFKAQLSKFDNFQIPLSHIDSHQHIHMIPFICQCIVPILNQHKTPSRIVFPAKNLKLLVQRPIKWLKQSINQQLAKKYKKAFTGKRNDTLVSIHDLKHTNVTKDLYYSLLNQSQEIVELMVHPYILGNDVKKMYPQEAKQSFLKKCEEEYKVLTNESMWMNYNTITYRDL